MIDFLPRVFKCNPLQRRRAYRMGAVAERIHGVL